MTTFFDSLQVGDITLVNRIIMAPMTRGRANEAGVQPAMAATYYGQRASAGLIITESVHISPMARANEHTPGIYTVEQIESWRAIADLPERFRQHAALNSPDFSSFYTSGTRGYTDYQPLPLQ